MAQYIGWPGKGNTKSPLKANLSRPTIYSKSTGGLRGDTTDPDAGFPLPFETQNPIVRKMQPDATPAPHINSDAKFVLYLAPGGIISEHENASQAAVAFYRYARDHKAFGEQMPSIYKRTPNGWVKV